MVYYLVLGAPGLKLSEGTHFFLGFSSNRWLLKEKLDVNMNEKLSLPCDEILLKK